MEDLIWLLIRFTWRNKCKYKWIGQLNFRISPYTQSSIGFGQRIRWIWSFLNFRFIPNRLRNNRYMQQILVWICIRDSIFLSWICQSWFKHWRCWINVEHFLKCRSTIWRKNSLVNEYYRITSLKDKKIATAEWYNNLYISFLLY